MPLYKLSYIEELEYEEYVEALSEEQAKEMFLQSLRQGELEPVEGHILELEIEEAAQ